MGKAERKKGLDYQAKVAAWLEARGWRVINLPIGGRWQKVRDVFGVDIIAKKQGRTVTLWIQATADPKASWKRKAVSMQLVPWAWRTDRVYIFLRRHSNDWEVRQLTPSGNLIAAGRVLLGTWLSAGRRRIEF